jgi:GNAT superfamily N-acetyltransferase
MKFEINPELVDQIIFGMENQEDDYYLDVIEGVLVPGEEIPNLEEGEEEERYIPLPVWRSVDGFNLMEQFTATLRNPVYRERLREILSSGRGVFRQFKNALKERPEIENLWFRFKNREMRKEVYRWYNSLRESWGLEEVEMDLEEPEDLLLSDFRIVRWNTPDEKYLLILDKAGFLDMVSDMPLSDEEKEGLYRSRRHGLTPSHPDSIVYRILSPTNDLAGFLWAVKNRSRNDEGAYHILQIFCIPEYRGIGLARALLEQFCANVLKTEGSRITIELLGTALDLGESLQDLGFKPFSQVLELTERDWETLNRSVDPT